MRGFAFLSAAVSSAAVGMAISSGPANAQYNSFMADVIGQTVAGMSSAAPAACYDGRMSPKPKDLADGQTRVQSAIHSYGQVASVATDLKPLFSGSSSRIWRIELDGAKLNVRSVRDPWIERTARVEPIGVVVGNQGYTFRGQWRAFAKDGSVLGTYDAWLYRKAGNSARFLELRLYSPTAAKQPEPLVPFCYQPGDIEIWHETKAKRAAEKAAKRAAKEAARPASQL